MKRRTALFRMGAAGVVSFRALNAPSTLAHPSDPEEPPVGPQGKGHHVELPNREFSPPGRTLEQQHAVTFSPDGRLLVAGGANLSFEAAVDPDSLDGSGRPPRIKTAGPVPTLWLWDAITGRQVRAFIGHPGPILAVAFSPSGDRIVSGGVAEFIAADESTRRNDRDRRPSPVSPSSFGRELVAAWHGGLFKVWETASGRELRTLAGHDHDDLITGLGFGRFITSLDAGRVVKSWDPDNYQFMQSLDGLRHCKPNGTGLANTGGAMSDDATRLVFYGRDRGWLWDTWKPRLREFQLPDEATGPAAIIPNGRWFATWSKSRAPILWDFETCQLVQKFQPGKGAEIESQDAIEWLELFKFSPDGERLAVGTEDGVIRIWAVGSGRRLGAVQGPAGRVQALAFLPDGGLRVASGGWELLKACDPKSGVRKVEPLLIWDAKLD